MPARPSHAVLLAALCMSLLALESADVAVAIPYIWQPGLGLEMLIMFYDSICGLVLAKLIRMIPPVCKSLSWTYANKEAFT